MISILNFLKSTSRQIFTKTKRLKGSKTIVFDFNIIFVFINCLTTNAFKKVQYGYHGKNGVFSDRTERTYSETYSSTK